MAGEDGVGGGGGGESDKERERERGREREISGRIAESRENKKVFGPPDGL